EAARGGALQDRPPPAGHDRRVRRGRAQRLPGGRGRAARLGRRPPRAGPSQGDALEVHRGAAPGRVGGGDLGRLGARGREHNPLRLAIVVRGRNLSLVTRTLALATPWTSSPRTRRPTPTS